MLLTIVFPDDHMLDGFSGSSHVHGVWQVCPAEAWVVDFFLQDLVRPVSDYAWNVIILHFNRALKVKYIRRAGINASGCLQCRIEHGICHTMIDALPE